MIGKSKLSNQVLVTHLYQSALVIITVKAISNIVITYWIALFGVIQNNADARVYGNVLSVINFSNNILVPVAFMYLVKCICELVYRFTQVSLK